MTDVTRQATEVARDLLDTRLEQLLERVAGESRVPAAGPVLGLVLALAAGLVAMAARRSRDTWPEAAGAAAQARALRARALPLAGLDAVAYSEAMRLLERPADDVDAEHRDWELAQALAEAAHVPLVMAQMAADVAELARVVAERSEGSVRPESVAAAELAEGAARAAAYLVETNLTTTTDDPRVVAARQAVAAAEASAAAARGAEATA